MKKFLSFILFFSVCICYAQQNRFSIGVEGGPGLSILYGAAPLKEDRIPLLSGSAGVTFQYNFKKIVSLRTGLLYDRKGFMKKSDFVVIDYNGQELGTFPLIGFWKLDYLSVPLLARVSFGKKVKFFLDGGLYLAFLIKAEITTNAIPTYVPRYQNDNTSDTKRFDMGVAAGAGFTVPIKEKFALSLEARNNVGLLNISKLPVNGGTIKPYSLSFLVAFEYSFGARK